MTNKLVVIHQPDFAPYLGFFHRFIYADLYVALDDVQFVNSSRGWTHRDKIKCEGGGVTWLSVSVEKTSRDTPIKAVKLSTSVDWRKKNLQLLEHNYRKSTYFDELMPLINSLYSQPFIFLKDLNMAFIELFMDLLEVRVPWVWSSDLGHIGTKNKLLLDILTKVDATHYLTGNGAKDYLNESLFTESGIAVEWQSFTHPIYSQQFGEFEPNLSVIDLLFNCGIEKSKIFLKGSK